MNHPLFCIEIYALTFARFPPPTEMKHTQMDFAATWRGGAARRLRHFRHSGRPTGTWRLLRKWAVVRIPYSVFRIPYLRITHYALRTTHYALRTVFSSFRASHRGMATAPISHAGRPLAFLTQSDKLRSLHRRICSAGGFNTPGGHTICPQGPVCPRLCKSLPHRIEQ